MTETLDNTKIPTTLLTLPPEIRNVIFAMVLIEPSGRLTLEREKANPKTQRSVLKVRTLKGGQPSYPEISSEEVSLGLLGTCKKLHAECKDLVWTHHTFVFQGTRLAIETATQAVMNHTPIYNEPYRYIKHLQLNSEYRFEDTAQTFEILEEWIRHGVALTSFTLKLFYWGDRNEPAYYSDSRASFELKVLRRLVGINHVGPQNPIAALQKLDRKLVMTSRLEVYFREIFKGMVEFEKIVSAMHQAFTGEMWVGERLWWKDGTQLLEEVKTHADSQET